MATVPPTPNPQPLSPIAWTIAGSDSGGGAGIQADLKAMQALGVHGCSAITALTAQNTQRVDLIEPTSPGMIEAQLIALQDDLPPDAIKIGMLGSAAAIKIVAELLKTRDTFVVCDPVMMATMGGSLMDSGAYGTFRDDLLPRVDLLTPNLHEAERLVSYKIDSCAEVEKAARDVLKLGPQAVLIKGGHSQGALCQDYWTNGRESAWLSSPRWPTPHTHGGGCTLSAAIAAGRALGLGELDAIVLAKAYTNHGLRYGGRVGQGRGPLLHAGWPDETDDMPWITASAEAAAQRLAFPPAGHLGLYPIVDRAAWLEKLLPLGVDVIQLRVKDLQGNERERELRAGLDIAKRYHARLYINDDWSFALKHGAYGVHLGQDDLPGADLAALAQAGIRLGVSTHGYAEVARALAVIPSYIAIGTIFESPSKTFTHTPLGVEAFARLRKLIATPVVAIGGITLERAPEVLSAGADGIAVISDLTKADDLPARVAAWKAGS